MHSKIVLTRRAEKRYFNVVVFELVEELDEKISETVTKLLNEKPKFIAK